MENSKDLLLLAIQERGCRSTDLRFAVHEACHAIELGVKSLWTTNNIHNALVIKHTQNFEKVAAEAEARAVEMLVMQHFNLPYDLDQWSHTAWFETLKNEGISLPIDFYPMAIKSHASRQRAKDLVKKILRLTPDEPGSLTV